MNTQNTSMHTVLVFDAIERRPGLCADFLAFGQSLLADLGCSLTKISHSRSRRSLAFRAVEKRMADLLPTMDWINLISLPPNVKSEGDDYLCNISVNSINRNCVLNFKDSLVPLRSHRLRDIADRIASAYSPKYGYVYQRAFKDVPWAFASCMSTDADSPEMAKHSCQWMYGLNDAGYLLHGWLRDVFTWNLLTNAHLDAPVGNLTLKEWIQQSPNRGTLTPVTDEMMLWEVPDERLTELSDQLYAAGRVFDAERDVLFKRPPPTQELSMEEATAQVLEAFGFDSPDEVEIRKGDNTPISEADKKRIFDRKPKTN